MWKSVAMVLVIAAVVGHVAGYGVWLSTGIILAALELREAVNR